MRSRFSVSVVCRVPNSADIDAYLAQGSACSRFGGIRLSHASPHAVIAGVDSVSASSTDAIAHNPGYSTAATKLVLEN